MNPARPSRLEVFAVEDRSVQLCWRHLGPGTIRVVHRGGVTEIAAAGGPGAIDLTGLEPGTAQSATLDGPGLPDGGLTIRFTTLTPPPGPELARFATVSDLHIGAAGFGFSPRIVDLADPVTHTIRCTAAAIAEAEAWGAERLVVKGDAVHHSRPNTWAALADVLAGATVDVDLIPGNHESNHDSTIDPFAAAATWGLRLHREVEPVDLHGLRLVLMDSTVPEIDVGRWNHLRGRAAQAAAEADGPAMVIVHHQPQPLPVPVYLPRGIPSFAAHRFVRAVRRANPQLFGTSGHTHRHRFRVVSGVPWTEVGSPKDYPGTWAGYVVHEGGIRQVVRRVADPDAIRWTERTAATVGGAWGRWSPGRIGDRCVSWTWPTR